MKIREKDKQQQQQKEKEDVAPLPPPQPSPPPEKVFYDNRIKRKNVLALNEKVAAIREYEKMPVYKRVGRMFHCSPDQIKRIVQQKDAILKEWEQRTRRCQDAKTLMKVVRVSMLGKAVYDWIRRMMYYKDLMITDGLIQKMALQFKSAMGLQNFFPHQDWCDKFRQTYKIIVNDSKQLKIAYTQGHSVQIKDIVKDVLTECTPEVSGESDGEDDTKDENANEPKPSTSSNQLQSAVALRSMPQLVALPIHSNRVGMMQKVLVATPITQAGQRPGAPPMTMTIIPLTTIAQPKHTHATMTEKPTVPPPMVQIKKEIKEEPQEELRIKEEYISDDEDIQDVTESQAAVADKEATEMTVRPIAAAEKSSQEAVDTMDYDNLALSSLRRIIQTRSSTTTEVASSSSTTTSALIDELSTAKDKTNHATVESAVPKTSTPPLPPLTRAPTLNRTANKRKHNTDTMPTLPPIKTCLEARKYLKLLEDFALVKENFRLIGLITRADEVLRELDGNDDVDVD